MTLRSLACAIGLDGLIVRLTLEPLGFHPGALGVRLLLRRGSRRLLGAEFFVLAAAAQLLGLLLAPVQFGLLALPAGHHHDHDHDERDDQNRDDDPDPDVHGNPFQTWLPFARRLGQTVLPEALIPTAPNGSRPDWSQLLRPEPRSGRTRSGGPPDRAGTPQTDHPEIPHAADARLRQSYRPTSAIRQIRSSCPRAVRDGLGTGGGVEISRGAVRP